jgi:plastocyanin
MDIRTFPKNSIATPGIPHFNGLMMKKLMLNVMVMAAMLPWFSSLVKAGVQMLYTYSWGFSPQTVILYMGDEISWVNYDSGHDHTFTSDLPSSNPGYWNVSRHAYDPPYYRFFNKAGTFNFHDQLSAATGSIIVAEQPSVTITYPPGSAVFTAPASFYIQTGASNAAYVEFFVDGGFMQRVDYIPPYPVMVTNLLAGSHLLTAIATDLLGYQATNAVAIVVNAAVITLGNPRIQNAQFLFDTANLTNGKTNVLQASTNLVDWISFKTNTAMNSLQTFTNPIASSRRFYRVVQLP